MERDQEGKWNSNSPKCTKNGYEYANESTEDGKQARKLRWRSQSWVFCTSTSRYSYVLARWQNGKIELSQYRFTLNRKNVTSKTSSRFQRNAAIWCHRTPKAGQDETGHRSMPKSKGEDGQRDARHQSKYSRCHEERQSSFDLSWHQTNTVPAGRNGERGKGQSNSFPPAEVGEPWATRVRVGDETWRKGEQEVRSWQQIGGSQSLRPNRRTLGVSNLEAQKRRRTVFAI